MAQVELQCGPYRVVSLMSREAADDLGLEPGVTAVAAVKSTNVVVELPGASTMKRFVAAARWPSPLTVAACSSGGSGSSSRSPPARRPSAGAVRLDHGRTPPRR